MNTTDQERPVSDSRGACEAAEGSVERLHGCILEQTARDPSIRWYSRLFQQTPDAERINSEDRLAEIILEKLEQNGVAGLFYIWLRRQNYAGNDLYRRVERQIQSEVVWELRHAALIREFASALNAARLRWCLIKGSGLAYCDYPEPWMRTRGDTDVLVDRRDRDRALDVFAKLGYKKGVALPGEWTASQASLIAEVCEGGTHVVDLHWQISNSPIISKAFQFDDLWARRRPVPAFGSAVSTISRADALLLSAIHRRVHRIAPYYVKGQAMFDEDRLIWIHDVHQLASLMSEGEWREFAGLARQKRLSMCALGELDEAGAIFGTPFPEELRSEFMQQKESSPILAYLASGGVSREWQDFMALESPRAQLAFVKEILFPPSAYMKDTSGHDGAGHLAVLYWKRLLNGLWKRLPGVSRG